MALEAKRAFSRNLYIIFRQNSFGDPMARKIGKAYRKVALIKMKRIAREKFKRMRRRYYSKVMG